MLAEHFYPTYKENSIYTIHHKLVDNTFNRSNYTIRNPQNILITFNCRWNRIDDTRCGSITTKCNFKMTKLHRNKFEW